MRKVLTGIFLTLLLASPVAAVTIYTDETAFQAALVGPSFVEDFDAYTFGSFQGVQLVIGPDVNGYAATMTAPGDELFSGDGMMSTFSAGITMLVSFTGATVYATGGWFFGSDVDGLFLPADCTVSLSDGTSDNFSAASVNEFRGYIASQPLDWMSVTCPLPDPMTFSSLDHLYMNGMGLPTSTPTYTRTPTPTPNPDLVGSFDVDLGPPGSANPLTYTCLETCALLFGGGPGNYFCSTSSTIVDHLAWASTAGSGANCAMTEFGPGTPVDESFKACAFYDSPGCTSAYVQDTCTIIPSINYCWINPAAPPPTITPTPTPTPTNTPKPLPTTVLWGSFSVHAGPSWNEWPPTYTCREACALVFGGNATDYFCSTDPLALNRLAWVSTWGSDANCAWRVSGGPGTPVSEDFKNCEFYAEFGCASAYVSDMCFIGGSTNYCWIDVAAIPPTPTPTATPSDTPTATETSTPTPTITPTPANAVCAATPLPNCNAAAAGLLKLRGHASDPAKQKLRWKWSEGTAGSGDFGDPGILGGTTSYRLCVYDDGVLTMSPFIDAGGTCDGEPCWSGGSAGLKYKNKLGNADGITQVLIKGGEGTATVRVKGKGSALQLPFPIADTANVSVQLVKNPGSGAQCWETVLPAPAKANDADKRKFLDKVP